MGSLLDNLRGGRTSRGSSRKVSAKRSRSKSKSRFTRVKSGTIPR